MIVGEMNKKEKKSYLKEAKIEFREYQINIAQKCVNKNSLVVLPTGLGKTIIAVIVAAKTLKLFPPDSKIIILAPTRPLINQHYNTFVKFLTIQEEEFCVLTGKVMPEKRSQLFRENKVVFFTPQTLRNDLVKRKYSLENTCLIIFDEAHHASGDYPYTLIADEYADQNPDGNTLALTASPGASKKKIAKLCQLLHIPFKNSHFRTRKDTDVKRYLKPMDIYKIGVNLTSLMKNSYSVLKIVIEERLQYLSQLSFLEVKSDNLFHKIIRKDLLKLNKELIDIIKGDGDKTGAYGALSINAQALILYHMIELVEQQGLNNVLNYFEEKIYKEALKRNSSKAVRILASDQRLRRIYFELKKNEDLTPENLIHPKYKILEKILLDELHHNIKSRILVFVKLRVSVSNIVKKLKTVDGIRPVRFVGQATKSKIDKGLSQKQQIEILDLFKEGQYNVLVSTNVGEEGLDIAECDMVVFYDVVASEIRFIQRKGRTARHKEGKVVILYTNETNDEIYMNIALNKLKKMNINLKNPNDLKSQYNIDKKEFKFEIKEENYEASEITADEDSEVDKNSFRKRKKKTQSNLQDFIGNVDSKYVNKISKVKTDANINFNIKISNLLPMKLGLRKKLSRDNILFKIMESDYHIVIFDKVVVQLYDPRKFSNEFGKKLTVINTRLKDKYRLIINIFNFIDFKESFEGEKRLLKRKIQEFGSKNKLQIIPVDNSEELFFIVKNIYEQNQNIKE